MPLDRLTVAPIDLFSDIALFVDICMTFLIIEYMDIIVKTDILSFSKIISQIQKC